jgi:hypothetical protein
MKDLIVVAVIACVLAFSVDAYWYQGRYFAALTRSVTHSLNYFR